MVRLLAAVVAWAACSAPSFAQNGAAADRLFDESRKVALKVSHDIRDQLVREMQMSGPLRSLLVCKYACPEILSSHSRKTGWRISAVSLRPRNPARGTPDIWEQRVLFDFDRRVAKGEKAETLDYAEVVTEPQGRFYRYAVAIRVEPKCLACHGAVDTLPDSVRAQLAIDYPFDKATGYKVGQVYGVVAIKRPF